MIPLIPQPMNAVQLDVAIGGDGSRLRVERLKNYVKFGLLPTFGSANPGTGKSRLYSDEAITIAKVLDMMSELGMRVCGQQAFIRAVADDADLMVALNDLVQARRDCK